MTTKTNLTLEEFWALPEKETAYELVNGKAIPKVSPKYFHSSLQEALLVIIRSWCKGKGRIKPRWAIKLKRNRQDWVPTPDLTYICYERLDRSWRRNEACPVPCDLAIEIISPGQTFQELADKASDYLSAGVLRVWIVDPEAQNITVFYPEGTRQVYTDDIKIVDSLLPGLELTVRQMYAEADLGAN